MIRVLASFAFHRRALAWLTLGLSFLPFAFAACSSKQEATVQFETKDFVQTLDACKAGTETCTYLKFQYPYFTHSANDRTLKTLNQEMQNFLLEPVGEIKSKDLESFAKDFFAGYQKARKDYPQIPGAWFVERTAKVDLNAPDALALEASDSEFTGGAHPSENIEFVNYYPSDGSRITLVELFVPDSIPKLTAIAEKSFREKQQIPAGQNLQDAGYFFENGIFKLNQNFLIGAKGLSFLFNPYEAAPYAMGPIQFEIPYEKLKEILKPDGILSRVMKNPGKKG